MGDCTALLLNNPDCFGSRRKGKRGFALIFPFNHQPGSMTDTGVMHPDNNFIGSGYFRHGCILNRKHLSWCPKRFAMQYFHLYFFLLDLSNNLWRYQGINLFLAEIEFLQYINRVFSNIRCLVQYGFLWQTGYEHIGKRQPGRLFKIIHRLVEYGLRVLHDLIIIAHGGVQYFILTKNILPLRLYPRSYSNRVWSFVFIRHLHWLYSRVSWNRLENSYQWPAGWPDWVRGGLRYQDYLKPQ